MAERDRAAVHVRPGEVELERAPAADGDRGKGFVDLDRVEIADREPRLASAFFVAGIGPVSMIVGSTPTVAIDTMRARGRSPCCFTARSLATSAIDAPSEICDEDPAVITPSSRNAGFSERSLSIVVSRRIPSSWTKSTSAPSALRTRIGTISFANAPRSSAAPARR
jgi:hypothetical protein